MNNSKSRLSMMKPVYPTPYERGPKASTNQKVPASTSEVSWLNFCNWCETALRRESRCRARCSRQYKEGEMGRRI